MAGLVRERGLRTRAIPWRFLGVWLAALALASVAAGCRSDANAKLSFLQAQPENDLVYPGATLLSTDTRGSGLTDLTTYVERQSQTSATIDQIGQWYSDQLGGRKWVGGFQPHVTGGYGGVSYVWYKPGLRLDLSDYPRMDGQTKYNVGLEVLVPDWQWVTQIQALRDVPEATLALPGAKQSGDEAFGATQLDSGDASIRVGRSYNTMAARNAIVEFYDSALTARGWSRVAQPRPENYVRPTPPAAQWTKDLLVASVDFNYTPSGYGFGLVEYLDSGGKPIPEPSFSPRT